MPTATDAHILTRATVPANHTVKTSGAKHVAGANTPTQLPDRAAKLLLVSALSTNTGRIFVGFANTVAQPVSNGSADATCGHELPPGRDMPWIRCENANEVWIVAEVAAEGVTFLAFS